MMECAQLCLMKYPICKSINIEAAGVHPSYGFKKCQLNNETRSSRPEKLVEDKMFNYNEPIRTLMQKKTQKTNLPDEDDVCGADPCKNGGICSHSLVTPYYTCQCLYPWAGDWCQDNSICSTKPCKNGGACFTTSQTPYYSCQCNFPYGGSTCEGSTVCQDANKCQNGGTCRFQSSEPYYVCGCPANYVGPNCQTVLDPSFTTSYVGCSSQYYSMDTDISRQYLQPMAGKCDRNSHGFVPGWKRFSGDAGTQMVTSCPSLSGKKCGSYALGYINGSLPSIQDGIVTRKVCFCYNNLPCWQTNEIRVQNCSTYILFDLPDTKGCYYRYCTH